MAKANLTLTTANAGRSIDYSALNKICNQVQLLALSISRRCEDLEMDLDPRGGYGADITLIRNAANTIGLLADHCLDYNYRGDATYWLDLPKMKPEVTTSAGGKS